MNDHIFNFSNPNWKYKGVLSAEVDFNEIDKEIGMLQPPGFRAEVLVVIWVDESGDWHFKGRIKFPSGGKHVFSKNMGKEVNETICLHEIYHFPMKHKCWLPNPSGTIEGLIEVMRQNGMIESMRVVKIDDETE